VYHILAEDIRNAVPDDVWEEQVGVMADALDADALAQAVEGMRAQAAEEQD
jgi:hypothetical protein